MPESSVLQTAPYKCLQSQFSVLYGEVTQVSVGREDLQCFTFNDNITVLLWHDVMKSADDFF